MKLVLRVVLSATLAAIPLFAAGCASRNAAVSADLISWVDSADEGVLKGRVYDSDLPVVLLFSASPCITCQPVEAVIDKVGPDFDGWVRFLKINTQNSARAVKVLKVEAIPTMVVFDGRKELERKVGAVDAKELGAILNRVLDLDEGR